MTFPKAKTCKAITAVEFAFIKGQTMTQTQALTQALILAIIAPTDEQATKATNLAENLAQGLNFDQVEQCKTDALEMYWRMNDDKQAEFLGVVNKGESK